MLCLLVCPYVLFSSLPPIWYQVGVWKIVCFRAGRGRRRARLRAWRRTDRGGGRRGRGSLLEGKISLVFLSAFFVAVMVRVGGVVWKVCNGGRLVLSLFRDVIEWFGIRRMRLRVDIGPVVERISIGGEIVKEEENDVVEEVKGVLHTVPPEVTGRGTETYKFNVSRSALNLRSQAFPGFNLPKATERSRTSPLRSIYNHPNQSLSSGFESRRVSRGRSPGLRSGSGYQLDGTYTSNGLDRHCEEWFVGLITEGREVCAAGVQFDGLAVCP